MEISVIIPNYNGERLLPDLLNVLERMRPDMPPGEVVVADDASDDGSVTLLRKDFPWARIVEGEANLGFGGNCNRGAEAARGEFLAFVNSDIRFETEPFSALVRILGDDSRLFAVMPLVYAEGLGRIENLNVIWKRRGLVWLKPREDLPLTDVAAAQRALEGEELVPAPLCGAFFVCRRSRFQEMGGFATEFAPAYWEDVDLGMRAQAAGYDVGVASQLVVRHLHSQTLDHVLGNRGKRNLLLRNQARLMERHLSRLAPLPWYRYYLAMRIPQRLLTGEFATAAAYLRLIMRRG